MLATQKYDQFALFHCRMTIKNPSSPLITVLHWDPQLHIWRGFPYFEKKKHPLQIYY